uniref:Uncharacterized protein n=1 Tax=Gasterosteus aculeatus TaxID=69293 RepID=G3P8V2_GASAC
MGTTCDPFLLCLYYWAERVLVMELETDVSIFNFRIFQLIFSNTVSGSTQKNSNIRSTDIWIIVSMKERDHIIRYFDLLSSFAVTRVERRRCCARLKSTCPLMRRAALPSSSLH